MSFENEWGNGISDLSGNLMLDKADTYLTKEISSMLVMGFEGLDMQSEAIQKTTSYLREDMLGGVIMFGYNIASPTQLSSLIDNFKEAKRDAFISVDQEGGRVQRLTSEKGFEGFLSQAAAAELALHEAGDMYKRLSLELFSNGINLNFAPVVDINNASNSCPVIGGLGRSFSDFSDKVIEYAEVAIDSHHENRVLTAIKHFPGHGFANADSHLGLVDVTETAKPEELLPFYTLVDKQKVDMIMTAHIVNRNLDPMYPATLSPVILKTLLRDKGYDGVVVSDDLHMGAILSHYSFEESIVLSINAGCDILVFSNNKLACKNVENFKPDYDLPMKFIQVVKAAIEDGRIDRSIIKNSYNRIEALRKKFISS